MFEDTKEATRSRKSNGQKTKYKRTNNDLQSITQETKDRPRATRTSQHAWGSGLASSSCFICDTRCVTVK